MGESELPDGGLGVPEAVAYVAGTVAVMLGLFLAVVALLGGVFLALEWLATGLAGSPPVEWLLVSWAALDVGGRVVATLLVGGVLFVGGVLLRMVGEPRNGGDA